MNPHLSHQSTPLPTTFSPHFQHTRKEKTHKKCKQSNSLQPIWCFLGVMQRSIAKALSKQKVILPSKKHSLCDVFINHRGIDTKRSIAGLLYNHLKVLGFTPFLDSKNMSPGDRLFDKIDPGIKNCKVGVAVFSPRYCESYFCLHELALMMECRKKVIPIFCDVKPSELRVGDNGGCSTTELMRFRRALEEAKYTVGLTFDTLNGDWSEFLMNATNAVIQGLLEVEENQQYYKRNILHARAPTFPQRL